MNNVCECWTQCHIVIWCWLSYCKGTYLEKWLQTGFVFGSVLNFVDLEIAGRLSDYRLPQNH